ncbi:mucin-21-like [Haliotis cracherodii]|uniref:mucin-21-like n=1 Tax=Haliotis cracherodii TaxID=6455 RepID=UPI0039EBBB45
MSVARLLMPAYIQHSALYSIWIFLWMDGSAADSAMSCKQFSNPDTETTVFKDDGCFLLSREERTWEESQTFCNGLGDGWSLVEIENVETQTHVDNVSRTAGVSTGSWIGLRRRNGKYTWESGNKLGYSDFFKELAEGEKASPGDCVTTSPPDDTFSYGIWNYMNCTARLYSICHSGFSLPPRKTMSSRRTTSSTMTLNATPAEPQTTVKYGATQSTAAPTQSTATTTQYTATTTQSTAATTQSTAAATQSTAPTPQSTATTMQSKAAATTQSTAATTTTTSSTTVLIAVSSAASFVAAVFLVGGVIVLCRRNKQKRLRVRTNDKMAGDDTESGTVADVRTKPEVVYAVVTKIQTKQPSQVHDCNTESGYHYASVDDGARPITQGVNDQTYDTATITEKKQPITFDNTYARAMFSKSAADTGEDVYDHTRVTGKASQEVDASHYDHAFVK